MDDRIKEQDAHKEVLQRLKEDFPFYAENCLNLVDNKGKLVPFVLNPQQQHLHEVIEKQREETGRVRIIVCKSRRLGISTYVAGRFTHKTAMNTHKRASVVTHVTDSTNAIFKVYKRFHANLPDAIRPELKKSNAKELEFQSIDSSIKVGTAGSAESGRGDSILYLHASEVAFWANAYEVAAATIRSVADVEGSEIILESTPLGIGSFFYDTWVDAEEGLNGYIPVFIPWTVDPDCSKEPPEGWKPDEEEKEYQDLYQLTDAQMFWRRQTIRQIGQDKFYQEYPISVAEAFRSASGDSFLQAEQVVKARKRKLPPEMKTMPLILGVDVAAMGKDKTCIVYRRGNTVEKYEFLSQMANDQVADRLIPIIIEHKPAKIFIDGTGGYGAGVAACLRQRGYDTEEIVFNTSPTDPQYLNKRAEMYGDVREWLTKEVSLPDEDHIEQDLTSFGYKFNVAGKLQLESKADVKKRLKRSPDFSDALALTFAYKLGDSFYGGSNSAWNKLKDREMDYAW